MPGWAIYGYERNIVLQALVPEFVPPYVSGSPPAIYADFSSADYYYNGITYGDFTTWLSAIGGAFTRASNATYFTSSGVLATAGNDALRFNYDPRALLPSGIFLEGASTNLILQSQNFTVTWSQVQLLSVTANATNAPDGSNTGSLVIPNTTNNTHSVRQGFTTAAGTVYTVSCYAKAGGGYNHLALSTTGPQNNVYFDLSNGIIESSIGTGITSATIQPAGGGWYRCAIIFTGTGVSEGPGLFVYNTTQTDGNVTPGFAGDGTSGLYLWGAQMEALAFATSYIPTTTTSATRAADDFSMTAANPFWTTGSFYAKTVGVTAVSSARIVGGTDGGDVGTHCSVGGSATVAETFNGATALDATFGSDNWSGTAKVMEGYDASGRSLCANAGAVVSDAGTYSSLIGNTELGAYASGGTNPMYGNIAQFGFWSVRATSDDLTRITSP